MVPILKEVYDSGHDYYHSVAVIKKGTMLNVETMRDLKGAKACFPKVGVQNNVNGNLRSKHELHYRSAAWLAGPCPSTS